ncbi:formin 5 isoform B [Micractinium conductrix]|uniref:Formin-like protein n=1 Tax=Micractinium conductrix TaxID=554055 RepID=A0A2P6VG63_9CHLO|nr:formin 5 isoform A [Micractinium conductrix]PSC73081.1 formin 5 isoform B [Micractinium conductrix]|eukprot:PSC73080.1 formin 5 isoform A [Micractinium conductrix]
MQLPPAADGKEGAEGGGSTSSTSGAASGVLPTPQRGGAASESAASADSGGGGDISPGRVSACRSGSLALGRRAPLIRFFTSGRKAVNLEILLRQLGSPADVVQAVDELDTRRLKVEVLRELQANMPDAAELEALHAYLDAGGDVRQLGRAEQLFAALRHTARLQQKLQVLQFKGGLPERAAEVAGPLSRIVTALDELRGSSQLALLLHTALRLGNALNAGRKAPQRGIRLGSLRKLADTRSMDGSTTLLHYLVALMAESSPGALLLGKPGSECSAVPDAAHWTFAELESQLAALSSGIDLVRREAAAAGSGGITRQLGALAGQAGAVQQRATALLAAARRKAADTLRYLGEEAPPEPGFSAAEPRRMLSDVRDFFALTHRAHADGGRMAVVLATLAAQRAEEEAAAEAARDEGYGRGQIIVPAQRLSTVAGCVEAAISGSPRKCYLCQRAFSPVWNSDGSVKRCVRTVNFAACRRASGDPNAARCDGTTPSWVVACKAGYVMNSSYKCVRGNVAQQSRTPGCAAANPDGTCTRCAAADRVLVPANAIYVNVGMPDGRCLAWSQVHAEARSVLRKYAYMPPGCIEVDTLFRCSQCRAGLSLTGAQCVPYSRGNKCRPTVRLRQYCARCNAAGDRCVACTGARSLVDGVCSLHCKLLFGIGCLQCSPTACTRIDPAYANGR